MKGSKANWLLRAGGAGDDDDVGEKWEQLEWPPQYRHQCGCCFSCHFAWLCRQSRAFRYVQLRIESSHRNPEPLHASENQSALGTVSPSR